MFKEGNRLVWATGGASLGPCAPEAEAYALPGRFGLRSDAMLCLPKIQQDEAGGPVIDVVRGGNGLLSPLVNFRGDGNGPSAF